MFTIYKLIFVLFSFLILTSCEEFWRNRDEKIAQENYTSPYQGNWVGNYSGQGSGELKFNISKSGSIEVTRITQNNQDTFYTSVYDGGAIYNNPSPNSGFTLYGNMETHSGTWKMGNLSGNWSVTKH